MEQEEYSPESQAEVSVSNLKKVTPFSKYLAMTLFVVLPFLGGYLGYTFAPIKIVEVERVIVKDVTHNDPAPEANTFTCFQNESFLVVSPLFGEPGPYIVKNTSNYDGDVPCEDVVGEDDYVIERGEAESAEALVGTKLIVLGGTSMTRGLVIYELTQEGTIVFSDAYHGGSRFELDGTIATYASIADEYMDDEVCADHDFKRFGPGLNHIIELDLVSLETTFLRMECMGRE